MTALCSGGGPSGIKPGVEDNLVLASGGASLFTLVPGFEWVAAIAPVLGFTAYKLPDLCAGDPPAMPAPITADELFALYTFTTNDAYASGVAKLRDILANVVWNQFCECTSGPQPAVPTAPTNPGNIRVVPPIQPGPITAGPFYPMLRADVKVLTLGCGTPARPAGWTDPTFDDSAWAHPVAPAGGSYTWAVNAAGFQDGAGVGANAALPGSIELCAPASPIAHNCEQFLLRWRVFLGDITPARACIRTANFAQAGPGWGTGFAYANGFQSIAPTNALQWQGFAGHLLPNQWNVICLDINSSNTASANTWGTEGGVAIGLDFTRLQANQNTTPCCPPDETGLAYLDQILKAVTLIQRQAVPFGYVASTAHAGLSGAGTLDISGLLGASVTVTTIPGQYGRGGSSPVEYFDMGFVTFGTPDGYPSSYRVERSSNVFLPSRCGAYTTLAYDLPPGVVATITELVREP